MGEGVFQETGRRKHPDQVRGRRKKLRRPEGPPEQELRFGWPSVGSVPQVPGEDRTGAAADLSDLIPGTFNGMSGQGPFAV